MPTLNDILNEIAALVTRLGQFGYAPNSTKSGDALEVWTLFGIASEFANRKSRFQVIFKDAAGKTLSAHDTFYKRAQRTRITAASSGSSSPPCHIEIHGRKGVWEMHSNLEFKGGSDATHEFDVSIITENTARALRTAGSRYQLAWLPIMSVECKHYMKNNVDPDVARALIGRFIDTSLECHFTNLESASISHKSPNNFYENVKPNFARSSRQVQNGTFMGLVSTRDLSASTHKLVREFRIKAAPQVDVSGSGAIRFKRFVRKFVDWFENRVDV